MVRTLVGHPSKESHQISFIRELLRAVGTRREGLGECVYNGNQKTGDVFLPFLLLFSFLVSPQPIGKKRLSGGRVKGPKNGDFIPVNAYTVRGPHTPSPINRASSRQNDPINSRTGFPAYPMNRYNQELPRRRKAHARERDKALVWWLTCRLLNRKRAQEDRG